MEQTLIDYLTNATWQIPLLAGGAWLFIRIGKFGPRTQHCIWLVVLALAVGLPLRGVRGDVPAATKRPAHIAAYTRTQSAEGKRCRRRPSSPSLSLPILNYRKSSLPFGGPRCGCLQQPQIGSSASISQYCCSASTEFWRHGVVRAS